MLKIGLTGSMGSGKSFVLSIFRRLGALTIESDSLVRDILEEPEIVGKVKSILGEDVVGSGGKLDKKAVAARIFRSGDERKKIEELIHPAVFERIGKLIAAAGTNYALAVVEVPLLFEGGYQDRFDKTVTVFAGEGRALERLRSSGFSDEDIRARLGVQMSDEEKKKSADYVIDNSASGENTAAQVKKLYDLLTNETAC